MDAEERKRIALGEFKLAIIAPAVNGTLTDPTMAAYFRRIAEEPLETPEGNRVRVKASTMACWRRRYLEGGFSRRWCPSSAQTSALAAG